MIEISYKTEYKESGHLSRSCLINLIKRETVLKINTRGKFKSFRECLEAIEEFESVVKEVSKETITCESCGECCAHAPEVSDTEKEYFLSKDKNLTYDKIIAGKPCPFGGKEVEPCKFDNNFRPLQCRILFCRLHIENFEGFFNKFADFLGWEKI